jgi:hypothetical protein
MASWVKVSSPVVTPSLVDSGVDFQTSHAFGYIIRPFSTICSIYLSIAGLFLPQRFQLDHLHEYAPNSTFILNLRPSADWVRSVSNWFGLGGRFLTRFHIDHNKVERRLQVLEDIYNNHSNFIREFVRQHPSHTLIEVNITSVDAGRVMADAFGLDESCWAQHNKNRKKENKDP